MMELLTIYLVLGAIVGTLATFDFIFVRFYELGYRYKTWLGFYLTSIGYLILAIVIWPHHLIRILRYSFGGDK